MEYYLTKDELYHHGIKGQKWYLRRYQNPDGTYTEEGLRRRKQYIDKESHVSNYKWNRIINLKADEMKRLRRKLDNSTQINNIKKLQKIQKEYDDAKRDYYSAKTFQMLEDEAIKKMTLEDIYDEKRKVNIDFAKKFIQSELVNIPLSLIGGGWIFIPNSGKVKTDNRISLEKQKQVLDEYDANKRQEKLTSLKETNKKSSNPKFIETQVFDGNVTKIPGKSAWDVGYSDEYKEYAINRAKNNNIYNLDFLEFVQNKEIMKKGGAPLQRAYAQYLNNPTKFVEEGIDKLKNQT